MRRTSPSFFSPPERAHIFKKEHTFPSFHLGKGTERKGERKKTEMMTDFAAAKAKKSKHTQWPAKRASRTAAANCGGGKKSLSECSLLMLAFSRAANFGWPLKRGISLTLSAALKWPHPFAGRTSFPSIPFTSPLSHHSCPLECIEKAAEVIEVTRYCRCHRRRRRCQFG